DFLAEGIGQHASVAETMKNHVTTSLELVPAHRQEQVSARRRKRMRRFIAKLLLERTDGREGRAVFGREPPQRAPETFAAQSAGKQREVNVATGFVPGAECARGNVVPHAFRRAAEEREFPV